jgi:hypothetical protein
MLALRHYLLSRFGTVLTLALFGSPVAGADDHVVAPAELRRDAVAASAKRAEDRAALRQFLASEPARQALGQVKLDAARVIEAASLLHDDELASLAARARQAQDDLTAGALTNQQLTYIVIALGTAVLILIILAA